MHSRKVGTKIAFVKLAALVEKEKMLYLKHVPGSALSDSIAYLWLLSDAPAHTREVILPSGTVELVINLAEDEFRIYPANGFSTCRRFSGIAVSGPYSRPFGIDTAEHAMTMGVHFRPGGAYPFLGINTSELLDGHADAQALWGSAATRLRARLQDARSHSERFRVLEQALLRLRATSNRAAVLFGLRRLGLGQSGVEIVAHDLGLSHRRFIEIFAQEVGMTPKLFSRVCRFQRVLTAVQGSASVAWTQVALAAGYFDQPHLVHDFRAFCGVTPTSFLKHRGDRVKDGHLATGGGQVLTRPPTAS